MRPATGIIPFIGTKGPFRNFRSRKILPFWVPGGSSWKPDLRPGLSLMQEHFAAHEDLMSILRQKPSLPTTSRASLQPHDDPSNLTVSGARTRLPSGPVRDTGTPRTLRQKSPNRKQNPRFRSRSGSRLNQVGPIIRSDHYGSYSDTSHSL
jgi:hypothetical protein